MVLQLAALSSLHLLMEACWPALDIAGQLQCTEAVMNKISFAFGDVVFDDCRLAFLIKVLEMKRLFEHEDCGKLLQSIIFVILSHLRARTRLAMTVQCLSALCQMMTIKNDERLILPAVMHLMEPLVGCILSVDRDNTLLAHLFVCLYHLFKLMTCACYEALFKQLRDSDGKKRLKDFLLRVFLVFRDLIKSAESAENASKMLFPARWVRFKLLLNNIIMVAMQELSEALCNEFLPVATFDIQLWHTYIALCAAFITQPILQQVETHSFSKELFERYGDMRVLMCFQLASLWSHLDERQCHFLPTMVASFVDISLIPHQDLRYIAIPMVVSFLIGEDLRAGTVGMVEGELFDKLDTCFAEGMGDEGYKTSFVEYLSVRVKNANVTDIERQRLRELTQRLNCLMELLLEYQTVMKTKCVHRTAFCLLSLINFYRYDVVRDENCHRFIDHLRFLLKGEGYTAEVAACMKLQADSLTWSGNALTASGKYAAQTEWARKELLYQAIIAQYNAAQ
uniref:Dedicator of cytokinesis TPR repeats region domain-containing protein n=2 Tax=Plectus sambesii TaxID=2011161 RepID=A0A914UW49_9BILA